MNEPRNTENLNANIYNIKKVGRSSNLVHECYALKEIPIEITANIFWWHFFKMGFIL